VLNDSEDRSERMTTLLRREIGLLLRFSHPYIVTFLGAVTLPNDLGACLVMELCLGGTAASRLAQKQVTVRGGLQIATQIASAVAYLHNANCHHRDIKPPNVFLANKSMEEPIAKLGDFGASRYFTARDVMTPLRGTPGYMAPEVASQSAYGISSDIFAMGTFLYEMIALRAPYTMNEVYVFHRKMTGRSCGKDERPADWPHGEYQVDVNELQEALLWAAQNGYRPDITGLDERVPGAAHLLMSCWENDLRKRPNAQELFERLQELHAVVTE
jgi:serine/threonine protein kinase